MIGYDMGGGGGGGSSTGLDPDDVWNQLKEFWEDVVDFVTDVAQAVYGWVETVIEIFRWVRVVVQEIYGVPMEQWIAHRDERTCPQCGSLNGQVWERGSGATPPAHNNCRCSRTYAFTEWRTREIVSWELRGERISTWSWQITGWA